MQPPGAELWSPEPISDVLQGPDAQPGDSRATRPQLAFVLPRMAGLCYSEGWAAQAVGGARPCWCLAGPGHDPHPSHVPVPMAKGPDPGPVGRGPPDRLEAAGLRILALRDPASCVSGLCLPDRRPLLQRGTRGRRTRHRHTPGLCWRRGVGESPKGSAPTRGPTPARLSSVCLSAHMLPSDSIPGPLLCAQLC